MNTTVPSRIAPELKEIVAEASRALAGLDAGRLEELAACCQALMRDLPPQCELARQARNAGGEMATFARVLAATQANVRVMQRLRELRQGTADYSRTTSAEWGGSGGRNGHH